MILLAVLSLLSSWSNATVQTGQPVSIIQNGIAVSSVAIACTDAAGARISCGGSSSSGGGIQSVYISSGIISTGSITAFQGGTWVFLPSGIGSVYISSGVISTGSITAFQGGTWALATSSVIARQDGIYTVTAGTGVWNTAGSSVAAAQSGSYTVTPGTGIFAVSGPLTDTQLRSTAPNFNLASSSVVARQDASYTVTPGTGTWNTKEQGSLTVTPGTGTWALGGSSVAAAQLGSYTMTPGTGSWTLSSSSSVARQEGSYTVTAGTGTFPVSGTIACSNCSGSASGATTVTPGTGTWNAGGSSVAASQLGSYTVTPGTGTWTVTGPLTDTQLRASAPNFTLASSSVVARQDGSYTMTPGTGTWATSQTTLTPGTGATNLGKAEDSVAGDGDVGVLMLGVRHDSLAARTNADGDYSAISTDANGGVIISSSFPTAASLGSTAGKTEIHKTFFKNTTAASVSVLGTYTVTTGKTLYITHLDITGTLVAVSATGVKMGDVTIGTPVNTTISSMTFYNPTTAAPQTWSKDFAEPMAIPSAAVFMSSVTPSAATATNWIFNFDGYEKQ